MQELIDSEIKNYMRKSYNNRRIYPETGENVPTLIRSIDDGFTPIKFPTKTEGISGKRVFDLPEIPYRAESAAKPIMLFRGNFPADASGSYITDKDVLVSAANILVEGTDYILSGSKERPQVVELINAAAGDWTYTDTSGKTKYYDIHFQYYGLGSVITAFDMENLQNENIKTKNAEIDRLTAAELTADDVNFADGAIRANAAGCEVRDTTEIGIIKMWGGTDLPKNIDGESNYLWLDGSVISSNDYPALFKAWGVTASQMRLPNFKGRFPIGAGEITNEFDTKQTFTLRNTGGEWKHKITVDEMPSHNHNIGLGRENGDGSYKTTAFLTPGTSWRERDTDKTGGDTPISMLPAYVVVNFIVRYR